jgi:hypothetical protein
MNILERRVSISPRFGCQRVCELCAPQKTHQRTWNKTCSPVGPPILFLQDWRLGDGYKKIDPQIMAIGREHDNNSDKPQTMGETLFSVDDWSELGGQCIFKGNVLDTIFMSPHIFLNIMCKWLYTCVCTYIISSNIIQGQLIITIDNSLTTSNNMCHRFLLHLDPQLTIKHDESQSMV